MKAPAFAVAMILAMAALVGCSAQPTPSATGRPRLAVQSITYDCIKHELTVRGEASPPRESQQVQVQVRSVDHPNAPVWRITPTNAEGDFVARGRYSVNAGAAIDLNVRLASVVAGERIFSTKALHPVTCT